MKKVIRENLFETNSSSVHAIVVNPKAELQIPETHVINFNVGEFGWELETYHSIEDRASYLWTAILEVYCKWNDNDESQKYYTEGAREWERYIIETINNEFKGNVDVYFEWPNKHTQFFYIDHSEELTPWLEILKNNPHNLLAYLLGADTEIRTGNDNDDAYPDKSCPEGYNIFIK